jgi:hypothetical protein
VEEAALLVNPLVFIKRGLFYVGEGFSKELSKDVRRVDAIADMEKEGP